MCIPEDTPNHDKNRMNCPLLSKSENHGSKRYVIFRPSLFTFLITDCLRWKWQPVTTTLGKTTFNALMAAISKSVVKLLGLDPADEASQLFWRWSWKVPDTWCACTASWMCISEDTPNRDKDRVIYPLLSKSENHAMRVSFNTDKCYKHYQ